MDDFDYMFFGPPSDFYRALMPESKRGAVVYIVSTATGWGNSFARDMYERQEDNPWII